MFVVVAGKYKYTERPNPKATVHREGMEQSGLVGENENISPIELQARIDRETQFICRRGCNCTPEECRRRNGIT